jgi:hypothetical protein
VVHGGDWVGAGMSDPDPWMRHHRINPLDRLTDVCLWFAVWGMKKPAGLALGGFFEDEPNYFSFTSL